ncbi:chemotaxis protein CheW [Ramlibacter sp.]|uniref:chemotaxis protein CheW n=1 Tax=Ramlibacter sp. TaxID=1917967 RepID=UPI003D13AC46
MNARVAPAWLLEYGDGRQAAFGLHATLALLDEPACAYVPGAPAHVLGLMRWEGRRLPLVDLARLDETPPSAGHGGNSAPPHALVLAWQGAGEDAVQLAAVAAPRRVTMIEVRDDQQCATPDEAGTLSLLAASWFLHEGRPVAVVDTWRLFSGWLAQARASFATNV